MVVCIPETGALCNPGDIAWVITATALVMIMTPGLGFFYGGLVRRKNLVSTIVQCMAIFAVVSLAWALWGYTLAFGPSVLWGFVGNFQFFGLNGVGAAADPTYSSTIPALLFFAFQLKFAAITPALIIGAFAGRIRFKPLLIFILAWVTFIYFPVAHWIWGGGGWLNAMGVEDFAGGMVVHTTAGVSALAAALVIGRGVDFGKESRPNNVPYVILGTAILWFGWFGFNAGSALSADDIAVNALVVTNLAAAAAGVSWMLVDWFRKGKPSAVGMCVGFVCGLAAVTPASGFVGPAFAMVIGVVAGVGCNFVVTWRARTKLDDSLDVFACHGVGGMWGTVATGLFASTAVNALGHSQNGLVYGNPHFALVQMFAVAVVASFAFVGTYIILHVINYFSPLRASAEEEKAGLDEVHFGEEAYYPASE
ncbi:MAG: ammonium transporter [Thermoplasmata archaeon]